ncbi:hypothetical protein CONPUDRAFT_138091 [Coniophora puteana RWD-64-598 SS2]|uniref:Uncharacterized protein n=1 Tax=Coniophora puteana (strain RWD-64-598) TaxID=741705 RepID=A0A5M3MMG4_CONPW|nr:uncharacterized protein CONPUDRAFT_138091 [Coniophora puteana RWD-64-598 SS2]EIW79974.1 hypothetical protein CONPUDRAFT_138091 [Coniophora puteana RWD-64-598 SS2]
MSCHVGSFRETSAQVFGSIAVVSLSDARANHRRLPTRLILMNVLASLKLKISTDVLNDVANDMQYIHASVWAGVASSASTSTLNRPVSRLSLRSNITVAVLGYTALTLRSCPSTLDVGYSPTIRSLLRAGMPSRCLLSTMT